MDRRGFFKLSALITAALAGGKLLKLPHPQHVTFSHALAGGTKTILMIAGKGIIGEPTFDGRPMTQIHDAPPEMSCWYTELESGGYTGSVSGDLQAGESGMIAASIGYSRSSKGAVVFEGSSTSAYLREET